MMLIVISILLFVYRTEYNVIKTVNVLFTETNDGN